MNFLRPDSIRSGQRWADAPSAERAAHQKTAQICNHIWRDASKTLSLFGLETPLGESKVKD